MCTQNKFFEYFHALFMRSDFLFKLPFCNSSTLKKIIPNALLFGTFYKNSMVDKSLIENICKSAVVLSVYPIQKNKKACLDKYEGIIKDYNFWYLTLVKKNSIVYIPTFKIYNMNIEIFN